MKKKHQKILSLITACILCMSLVCARQLPQVNATTVTESTQTTLPQTETIRNIQEECVELREQYVKYFQNDDNTRTATVYDSPVHYQDGDTWKEIDNSFVSATLTGDAVTGIIKRDDQTADTQTAALVPA